MKVVQIVIGLVFLFGLVCAGYYLVNRADADKKLAKEHRYTISKQVRRLTNSKYGKKNYEYLFEVKGRAYYGRTTIPLEDENGRYFIEYYPPDPGKNKITEIEADSADITNLPPDGYPELPKQK